MTTTLKTTKRKEFEKCTKKRKRNKLKSVCACIQADVRRAARPPGARAIACAKSCTSFQFHQQTQIRCDERRVFMCCCKERVYHGGDEFDLRKSGVPAAAHHTSQQSHCISYSFSSNHKTNQNVVVLFRGEEEESNQRGANRHDVDDAAMRAPRHATPSARSFASLSPN